MRFRVVAVFAFVLSSNPALAQERVDPIPMGPENIVKALSPFRGNPDSSKVARLIERQAEKTAFPSSDYDHVLVARLWRRAGQRESALESLGEIDAFGSDSDLAMYERARVWLESDTNQSSGVRAYWSSCGTYDERVRAEIAWDLLVVTIPEEREAWPEVEPGEATCEWLREFWDERAVRMAVSTDDRVAKHYLRLAHAREWYWIPRPRFSISMPDYHGRPEGLALDDRGLIFVRMGYPRTYEGFLGGGTAVVSGSLSAAADPIGSPDLSICWPYWRPSGYRIFCFGQGPDRADGDYRLAESVGGAPGTMFFQKYVRNSNLPKSAIFHRIRSRGGGLMEPWQRALDRVESRAYSHQIAVAIRENVREVLEGIPDAPNVEPTVRVRIETLRFLNPLADQCRWQLWLLASARAGDLTPSSRDGDTATFDVHGRYSVLKASGVMVRPLAQVTFSADSVDDDSGIPLSAVFCANPGPLPLTVVIEDLNAPGTGARIQDTVQVPAIGGLPQLSDIAVAQSEGGTWTRDGETFLQVSPAHITNLDGSIHTYFEVYGVRPGTEYDVELRLVRADDAEDIWRLGVDDLSFRLQFRSEMSGDIGRHHLRLELGDTKPGEYMLAVRIQDADTGTYSLPAITDLFVAKR